MESPQYPDYRGRSAVEWIGERAYLSVRDEVDAGDFPSGTWIIGADDSTGECLALYFDSRGVRRVYRTTLEDDLWRVWRTAPEFDQRFTGKLTDGGKTIRAQWETSEGDRWRKDFDLIYRKVG